MILYSLSLIGVAVFAISGAIAAGRKQLDWVGVVALGVVTSLGGGTIRDVLLKERTVFWIEEPAYLVVAIVSSLLFILYTRFSAPPGNSLRIADALGLALFSIAGAQISEAQGCAAIVVILMGITTGVAGGIIREALSNETPMLFRSSEPLYSVAALAGILGYLLMQKLGMERDLAAMLGAAVVATVRLAAMYWNIRLPAFSLAHHSSSNRG